MGSTTTLRSDTARTGTNPDFPIRSNPWRKYVSMNLGTTVIAGTTVERVVRAGVLVVQDWLFSGGAHSGETHTLVLVATTSNEIFCYAEGALLTQGTSAAPLWQLSLGVTPMMRATSNIRPPIGICGTPVVDVANRRMFVVAMWDDGTGTGHYSIFSIALDTGTITTSQELTDAGAPGRPTFDGNQQDQRGALNLVDDWLWVGFAAYQAYDRGSYFGWVVAINPSTLSQQLYQAMISKNSNTTRNVFAAGVWGPGGVAAADDGTVFALTGNATGADATYWAGVPAAGPGSLGDYFNALVRLGITISGGTPHISVLDWFQSSSFTHAENDADFDFGGSSPLVLPPINGRQLVSYVPKDGNIFVHDAQALGNYSSPLTLTLFADSFAQGGDDTKAAIAFARTPDARSILVAAADSAGSRGGLAAFQVDATVTPPTLTQLWQSSFSLRDSFGSPIIVANPLGGPAGLVFVIDGDDAGNNYLNNCALRAYDLVSGAVVYDSTTGNDVTEQIPHFAPITSGGNSVFCGTSQGFVAFTQFTVVPKSLTFIVDRSTFGRDEVEAQQPTSSSVASFSPAYWIAVHGCLPSDLGLTTANLGSPPQMPSINAVLDPSLTAAERTAIQAMLNAGSFSGPVVSTKPSLPDEPQDFLFPFTVAFTGSGGFQAMASATPPLASTLVTLQASLSVGAQIVTNSTQIELVTGADPYVMNVDPANPTQPSWLSFDLRFFKVTGNSLKFGALMSNNAADAPGFIANVIDNLNNAPVPGTVGSESFADLEQDEELSALEWNPTDNSGHNVFNFALARVRLVGKTNGPTPSPVRVFFRLFQAQNTVSNFDPTTTYRFATDGTPHGRKIPLLGVEDVDGSPEYVTIPCFATARNNLNVAADMSDQSDPPNARTINMSAGTEVDTFFGCWIDNNQPSQLFLPTAPPAGNIDGPWTAERAAHALQSIGTAISVSPHQCLIAEIRYDDAPVIPNQDSGTSDKLAQRNIAWLDAPNPGVVASRRVTHPVQIKPTAFGAASPDELMILWGRTPTESTAELYLPALEAAELVKLAEVRHAAQHLRVIDAHTVGFDARGVTFIPLPSAAALAAGLLTVTLPPGIRKGEAYDVLVRQLTEATAAPRKYPPPPPPPPPRLAAKGRARGITAATIIAVGDTNPTHGASARRLAWQRVVGAFQFAIQVKTKEAILLNEERLLATLRWLAIQMPTEKRWYPIVLRYIEYVAGRVRGFGGNPTQILPSPTGAVPGLPGGGHHHHHPSHHHHHHHHHHGEDGSRAGKVRGLLFDHFGDFEGFILETDDGHEQVFFSREHTVRELVTRAKNERSRIRVVAEHDGHQLVRVVML